MFSRPQVSAFVLTLVVMAGARSDADSQCNGNPSTNNAQDALETVLEKWEAASVSRHRFDAKFHRFKYDRTFQIEFRGSGRLAVDDSGIASYRIDPVDCRGAISKLRGDAGHFYEIKPEQPELLYWTGEGLIRVHETDRTYELLPPAARSDDERRPDPPSLPEEGLQNPKRSPVSLIAVTKAIEAVFVGIVLAPGFLSSDFRKELDDFAADLKELCRQFPFARPYLLGPTADSLHRRFEIELLNQTVTKVTLRFVPKLKSDQRLYKECLLVLSKADYTPLAIKIIDQVNSETVHVFDDIQLNRDAKEGFEALHPDLGAFRKLQSSKSESEQRP